MRGQWIGKYQGSVEGVIMVNIDEVEDHYEIVAYVNPTEGNIPISVATVATDNKSPTQQVVANVYPVDPSTGFICEWDEIEHRYPGIDHSKKSDVELRLEGGQLHLDSTSDIDVKLSSILTKPSEEEGSKIRSEIKTWKDFKSEISETSKSKYLFRGQKEPWRLRTSFFRRGRYCISEFINKDVKQLHQRLSAMTAHYFDLSNPEQNGSFFNLVQHHGYPTPLLDWTYSPYVAAFFAFRDWPIRHSDGQNCRIYIFDYGAWQKHNPQEQHLDPPFPHLSVMEFIAIANPRHVPQQAVTTMTNIDDIEAHVLEREAESGIKYLRAIDISAKEREVVMRDLGFMGITAGSMFPGIDGVCEEIRERNFSN